MAHTVAAPKRSEAPAHGNGEAHPKTGFWALTLGSLGVVYGDIGTSPLYALREAVVATGGPGGVAAFCGPIMAVWFVVIALGGLVHLAGNPSVLRALNPLYGLTFLAGHGMIGLVALGAVFLAVTGAEALYADLGHFGRKPIQTAWTGLVLPALALNDLGQGAPVLPHQDALTNPFFPLSPY